MRKTIDALNDFIGQTVSWLGLILVLVIVIDVLLRYILSITSAASFELEWHLFAVLFLLSAGWTLKHDKHVRVDVFYQRFSGRQKAWVNLMGSVFLLFPLCCIGVLEGVQFAWNAYVIGESSPDPGGLPHRFLIKSAIPFGFMLLGLQGVSIILTSIKTIRNDA